MDAYGDHANHDEHAGGLHPADLAAYTVAYLWAARDEARHARDLVCTLLADNELEDREVFADKDDIGDGGRYTCRPCADWADHVHDPLTAEHMPVEFAFWGASAALMAATAEIASKVFALASVAPATQWQRLTGGAYLITVRLDSVDYEVTVPAPAGVLVQSPYISGYRLNGAGGVLLPIVYANARATRAIAAARRFARH